jgi:UDP-N-acetylmuramoyl-tripeptide--D-alanyl-D-alanine ligase
LANYHRKQLKTTIIAITGTNGKTTTKELVATALSAEHKVLYTQGNLNNHIGVPLTLLQLKPEHGFAVVEMGANHPGEIAALCAIAEPDYGLITNIGKAHLEGFGSFEGVIRTKTELYDFIRKTGGKVFANVDNPILSPLLKDLDVILYGTKNVFIKGFILDSSPFLRVEWERATNPKTENYRIDTHLVGAYNFENVMAAVCVASYFGVNPEAICRAIGEYVPQNNRSQNMKTTKNRLIIDAYNANPSSMKVALDNFLSLSEFPKMVILGEMKELGEYSSKEHQLLVDRIRESAVEQVFLCGENFRKCTDIPSQWTLFSSTEDLSKQLQTADIKGYLILVKGSRSNQLEKVTEWL